MKAQSYLSLAPGGAAVGKPKRRPQSYRRTGTYVNKGRAYHRGETRTQWRTRVPLASKRKDSYDFLAWFRQLIGGHRAT